MRHFILICFCFFNIVLGANTEANSLFERGNQAYQQKEYRSAIGLFKKVEELGFISDDLYLNLGNSYLKDQEIGLAVLNYEKALLVNSSNQKARKNLEIAKESIINPLTHIPDFILVEWWQKLVNSNSTASWVIFHLVFLFLALIIAFSRWTRLLPVATNFSQGLKGTILLGLCILFSLISLLASYQRDINLFEQNYVIILNEATELKDGPDERSNEIAMLSEGVKGKIIDQIGEWYKLQMDDKDEGWVSKSSFAPIQLQN